MKKTVALYYIFFLLYGLLQITYVFAIGRARHIFLFLINGIVSKAEWTTAWKPAYDRWSGIGHRLNEALYSYLFWIIIITLVVYLAKKISVKAIWYGYLASTGVSMLFICIYTQGIYGGELGTGDSFFTLAITSLVFAAIIIGVMVQDMFSKRRQRQITSYSRS